MIDRTRSVRPPGFKAAVDAAAYPGEHLKQGLLVAELSGNQSQDGDVLRAEVAAPGRNVEVLPFQQCPAFGGVASILEVTAPLPAFGRHCAAAYPGYSNDCVFSVQERLAFKAKKEYMLRNSFRAEGAATPAEQASHGVATLLELTWYCINSSPVKLWTFVSGHSVRVRFPYRRGGCLSRMMSHGLIISCSATLGMNFDSEGHQLR